MDATLKKMRKEKVFDVPTNNNNIQLILENLYIK